MLNPMHILVTHGSRHGGTEGLARAVGEALADAGHTVEVRPANEPDGLDAWDAVIVGGALYAGRWQRHARRFVERHVDELRCMPVWFFSSGPLDDSASGNAIAATPQVRRLMRRVNARGHVTFGGRLAPDATGFIARAMVKQGRAGDWRDLAAVRAWARGLARELAATAPTRSPVALHRGAPALRAVVAGLCLGAGLMALTAGIAAPAGPEGALFGSRWLASSIVAVTYLVGVALVLRRHRHGQLAALVAGLAGVAWMLGEMSVARTVHWSQAIYLLIGLATVAAAALLSRWRHAALRARRGEAPLRLGVAT